MNGRVYDPALGVFLSPDNFVQEPTNTQNFNRYSYCLNNPLMYTDPSGYTWLSHFAGWGKDVLGKVLATRAKLFAWAVTYPVSVMDAAFNGNLSRLDPFNKGTISNNFYQINAGLTEGTPKQIISRFTYELPQTILGYGYSQGANYFGKVESVGHYDGATVVQRIRPVKYIL